LVERRLVHNHLRAGRNRSQAHSQYDQ
jgi:hypothetical protein